MLVQLQDIFKPIPCYLQGPFSWYLGDFTEYESLLARVKNEYEFARALTRDENPLCRWEVSLDLRVLLPHAQTPTVEWLLPIATGPIRSGTALNPLLLELQRLIKEGQEKEGCCRRVCGYRKVSLTVKRALIPE